MCGHPYGHKLCTVTGQFVPVLLRVQVHEGLDKEQYVLARKYNFTLRYIDDLLVLNNTNFSDAIRDIYPSEVQLKKTTESTTALLYLNIFITIQHGKYCTTVYDKFQI